MPPPKTPGTGRLCMVKGERKGKGTPGRSALPLRENIICAGRLFFVPRHAGQQQAQTAKARHPGKDQARAHKGAQPEPLGPGKAQGQAQQHHAARAYLDLAEHGQAAAAAHHGKTGLVSLYSGLLPLLVLSSQ